MKEDNILLKKAKQNDNGNYALLGMIYQCSSYLNIDINSEQTLEIVKYFLYNINYCDFFEWLRSKQVYEYMKNNRW